jgi:hypothetical protein
MGKRIHATDVYLLHLYTKNGEHRSTSAAAHLTTVAAWLADYGRGVGYWTLRRRLADGEQFNVGPWRGRLEYVPFDVLRPPAEN